MRADPDVGVLRVSNPQVNHDQVAHRVVCLFMSHVGGSNGSVSNDVLRWEMRILAAFICDHADILREGQSTCWLDPPPPVALA